MKSDFFASLWKFHHRLFTGVVVGLVMLLVLQLLPLPPVTRAVVSFDCGVLTYLLLAWQLMRQGDHSRLLLKLKDEDEGGRLILFFALLAVSFSLLAIIGELDIGRKATDWLRTAHILLTVCTIFLSWLFIQVLFALHYAHLYYHGLANGKPACLIFPEDNPKPEYGDFVYFACVIGTSGQTADVSFATARVRKIGTIHCVFAFFYNAAVLALMINIASGLFN